MQIRKRYIFSSAIAILAIIVLILSFRGGLDDSATGGAERKITTESGFPVVVLPKPRRNHNVPDFSAIADIPTRKAEFFSYLLPAVDEQNEHILRQREQLLQLHAKYGQSGVLETQEQQWLQSLAEFYRVDAESQEDVFATLIRRVDIIPDTLVLIQAANESGWGTSRFAMDARNFFGQWCWTKGCGLVPSGRGEGQIHEVREFNSVTESVRSYIRNLNTHDAYQELRQIRAELRQTEQPVMAQPLTYGLMAYSERGEDYIIELNQMIRFNMPIIREVREQIREGEQTDADNGTQTASITER
ncbi:peptidoglycan hydrolase [Aliidiomarina iranensis]|uniref:Peptidoglycan hydrolase n=1 Tax=Aliidiomarina iranensis TaxID=1434071 RepID=A0A432W061_9GAMM|nr:glucosaminidase domain-containing protein [Aliidiomarina iranensis]RUO22373.1 peptidoglycan hydrolase [Aliidiomarina iranensis]